MSDEIRYLTAFADGIGMDYFAFGKGSRAFVILPGLSLVSVMKSAPAVADAYARFGDDFTVYVFDRRKNLPPEYSDGDMAEDTAKVMKHIGIEKAYVFGASQGGMMAVRIAAGYPGLVSRAVIGSCAVRPSLHTKAVVDRWRSFAAAVDVRKLNHDFFESIYSPELLARLADSMPVIESSGTVEDCRRFMILSQSVPYSDISDDLKRVKCPLLAIGAENDKVFPGDYAREAAEMSGCEYYVYKHYGHAVYDEAPDYKDRIAAFFG